MADAPRLTLADQVLVNAMLAAVLPMVADLPRRRMHLAVIEEVLPQVARDGTRMAALAKAAEEMVAAMEVPEADRAGAWNHARWGASEALARFAEWRLGLARGAMGEKAA